MAYEIFYRTYGHVGQYETVDAAIEAAKPRANENERYVTIVDKKTGQTVAQVFANGEVNRLDGAA